MLSKNYVEIVDRPEEHRDNRKQSHQLPEDEEKQVIWDHPQDDETWSYNAYVPWDAEDVLVLADRATEEVKKHVEKHGWDVVWEADANRAPVREPVEPQKIPDSPKKVTYIEDPPDHRIRPLNRRGAMNLVKHRYGMEIPEVEMAWYWPERNAAAVFYPSESSPDGGDVTHIPVPNLSKKERRVANCMADPEESDDDQLRQQIEERAEELEDTTFYSRREGEAVAARELGLENQEFGRIMGHRRNIANQYVVRAKKKYKKAKRTCDVDEEIFEDRRGKQSPTDG